MSHLFADGTDVAALRQDFHRFDRCPPHQTRALFGDPAAVHRGAGFVVRRRQPGPTGQLRRSSEAVHVPDLGDEQRRRHRPDAGDLLDRAVAGVIGQPALAPDR